MPTLQEELALFQKIDSIKATLRVQHGIEDKDIPLYLNGVRALRLNAPYPDAFLPKNKISTEDLNNKLKLYTECQAKMEFEIVTHTAMLNSLQEKLKDPNLTSFQRQNIACELSRHNTIISQSFGSLTSCECKLYELKHLKPTNIKAFYTEITPLMDSLCESLTTLSDSWRAECAECAECAEQEDSTKH